MRLLVVAILVLSTVPALASKELMVRQFNCEDLLEPKTSRVVRPWFHEENPETADVRLTFMKHNFGDAFEYSADGEYVAVRHEIYPDAEQISLHNLETGELLSSLIWRGKDERLFSLRSLAIDGEARKIVAFADNFFTDETDAVLVWDGMKGDLVEHVEVQPPQKSDFVKIPNTRGNNISFRSAISLEHPYIHATRTEGGGWTSDTRDFNGRIINWQTRQLLNLPDTSVETAGEPINPKFQFFAFRLNDFKTIRIRSFADVQAEMAGQQKSSELVKLPAPQRLLARFQEALSGIIGRPSGAPALPAPELPQTGNAVAPTFHSELPHTERVISFQSSLWAPFLVSHTKQGLHVWNTKTGQLIQEIPGEILHFRVLEKMAVLAYRKKDGTLVLHSLFENKIIGEFAGIRSSGEYVMRTQLENWQPGVTYISTDEGHVTRVTEIKESGLPTYKIEDLELKIAKRYNKHHRTMIKTEKDEYLIQVYEEGHYPARGQDLMIEIYSLSQKARVTEVKYPMHDFHTQIDLDPKRLRVLYTAGETETGILSLPRLLKDLDL